MSAHVIDKSVCFNYITRVYSVDRDISSTKQTNTRKQKLVQTIHDPKKLKELLAFKAQAHRACRSAGTKLEALGVWLVPEDHAAELERRLAAINAEWDKFCNEKLFPNYLSWVQEYASQNPNDALDIIRLAPTLQEVMHTTRFVTANLRIKYEDIKSVNLDKEILSLPEAAVFEISAELRDNGLVTPKKFTQSTRKTLERVMRKARVFQDMHPRLQELHDCLSRLLPSLPTEGTIKDPYALAIRGVIDRLMEPQRFMREGFGVDVSQDSNDAPEPVVQPVTVLPVATKLSDIIKQGERIRHAAVRRTLGDPPVSDDSPTADDFDAPHVRRRGRVAMASRGDTSSQDWSGF